jgi:hypothetical protein
MNKNKMTESHIIHTSKERITTLTNHKEFNANSLLSAYAIMIKIFDDRHHINLDQGIISTDNFQEIVPESNLERENIDGT